MNLLDLLITVTVVSAVIGGWRLGFLARAASWVGLALGLIVAARLLPTVVEGFQSADPTNRLLVAAGVLVGGAFLGQALGLLVGAQFHRAIPVGPLRIVDRSLGAVAGIVGVLVAVWAMLPSMAVVRGWPAEQARSSVIAKGINELAPNPPDTLQALRRLVGEDSFPEVFSDPLQRGEDVGPPPEASGLPAEVTARVATATVKVEGVACNRVQEGSGFVAAPDVVVTNAHVVAGQDRTTVQPPGGGKVRATVVVFDPNRDLAVLTAPGLARSPLPVGEGEEGQTGAVFGHPDGQDDLRVAPATVVEEIVAVGRDLYSRSETRRQVYILASRLRPGDSGAALVDQAGVVVGVAFAIAPDQPDTAYALTTDELRPVLAAPRNRPAATGPCLRG